MDHICVHALHVGSSTGSQATVDCGTVVVVVNARRTDGHQFSVQAVEHVSQKLVSVLLVVATEARYNLWPKKVLSLFQVLTKNKLPTFHMTPYREEGEIADLVPSNNKTIVFRSSSATRLRL